MKEQLILGLFLYWLVSGLFFGWYLPIRNSDSDIFDIFLIVFGFVFGCVLLVIKLIQVLVHIVKGEIEF